MSIVIYSTTPAFVAEVGDDNRCTMHRGTDYDDLRWVRDMQRTTVSDVANTCEQEGVAVPA